MKTRMILAGLAIAAAGSVQAETVSLTSPTFDTATLSTAAAGQTLRVGSVDMSVYWTQVGTAHEVVAYYQPKAAPGAPLRLIMALEDGDATTFKLPGQADVSYTFARSGDVTSVTAQSSLIQLAAN